MKQILILDYSADNDSVLPLPNLPNILNFVQPCSWNHKFHNFVVPFSVHFIKTQALYIEEALGGGH